MPFPAIRRELSLRGTKQSHEKFAKLLAVTGFLLLSGA